MVTMARYWINQPSTSQPAHAYHGLNVIGVDDSHSAVIDVYPTTGEIVSMRIPRRALSRGWRLAEKDVPEYLKGAPQKPYEMSPLDLAWTITLIAKKVLHEYDNEYVLNVLEETQCVHLSNTYPQMKEFI